jgi:hypothetical protein
MAGATPNPPAHLTGRFLVIAPPRRESAVIVPVASHSRVARIEAVVARVVAVLAIKIRVPPRWVSSSGGPFWAIANVAPPSSSKAAARPICADLVMIFSVPISRTTRRTFDSTACSQIRNLERIQPAYHNWICRSEAALLFKLSTNRPTFAENLSRIACASRPTCRETVFTPRAN